jgi:hypothetical protein
MPAATASSEIELVPEVTCPNCWHPFPPEAAVYIAGHSNLAGDPRLEDPNELRRFVPTRFRPDCAAIDVEGTACRELACPNCHLLVPRVLFERRSLFLSIFGRPTSGKSYFLAAMTRQMKRTLPKYLGLGVTQPHPSSNKLVQDYENSLFNHPNVDALVSLDKTQESGSRWYQFVKFGDSLRPHPRPMFFQITPLATHPRGGEKASAYARTLCLYDNAGESFTPGKDTANNPVTQHMSKAAGLFFVFDPTQEPMFLRACRDRSDDPQVKENLKDRGQDAVNDPQHVILSTADQSVKKLLRREVAQPLDVPLMVILTKFDAWKHLLGCDLPAFHSLPPDGQLSGLRLTKLEEASRLLRNIMLEFDPAIVAAAERFSRHVYYVPCSATGCSPRLVGYDASGKPIYKFRVGDLAPQWAEVPLLWMLSRHVSGLVPTIGGDLSAKR